MGSGVSTGVDNDDLVDKLVEADYIRSPHVERIFRAVDRGEYFLPRYREDAYKDLAWKYGNLHISAPCIYCQVMEGLLLEPGMSFLNLGSGTGYLSTMAGLMLGPFGMNHGIELHSDVVDYARMKVEKFKRESTALDEYEFCEPKFIQGNCLCLSSEMRQYDRVYCGAVCPQTHVNYMKNLLKIGGVLIAPINDQLNHVTRTSETSWETKPLLPVSFATLVMPQAECRDITKIVDGEPLSLQEICRSSIRTLLRHIVESENPDVKNPIRSPVTPAKKKRALSRMMLPISEEASNNNALRSREFGHVFVEPIRGQMMEARDMNSLLNLVLGVAYSSDLSDDSDEEMPNEDEGEEEEEVEEENAERMGEVREGEGKGDGDKKGEKSKRDKFDSGLGDDMVPDSDQSSSGRMDSCESTSGRMDSCESTSGRSEEDEAAAANQRTKMEPDPRPDNSSDSSSSEEKAKKRSPKKKQANKTASSTRRRFFPPPFVNSDSDSSSEGEEDDADGEDSDSRKANGSCPPKANKKNRWKRRPIVFSDSDAESRDAESPVPPAPRRSPYTELLKAKIDSLPIPPILKYYLNLNRH